jgi:HEPN domain-containing protein
MPLDPVLVEDTRNWLIKASEDLDAAVLLIGQKPPRVSGAAFHTQQAAEKVLKGFLTWHDRPFKKTHDLTKLGKACADLEGGLAAVTGRVASISDWAIETRYPGNWTPLTKTHVLKAIRDVKQLFKRILSSLPRATHP